MQYDKYLFFLLLLWLNWNRWKSGCGANASDDDTEDDHDDGKDARYSSQRFGVSKTIERSGKQRGHKFPTGTGGRSDPPAPAGNKVTEQLIIQAILKGYDWRVRPNGLNASNPNSGGPVKVSVNIYLRSISKIDDVNMEYSAQFTFREAWTDPRLNYTSLGADGSPLPSFIVLATADTSQQIWMPDTFFQNEKEARKHMIDKPNVLIRIYPSGDILYSVRLSMVLSCPMSLEYYPLDEQRCLIDLASYAYTTDDIEYDWKNDTPVQLKEGLGKSLPSFELQAVNTDYCTSRTNTGSYSCLRTMLILRREFSYYLLQLYIPSFMLVIVSWVSFWLDKDSVPARVTLGVTTLLTMTTQSSGINAKLPPVSYTKAIDVWIGVCLAFIFGALLEFALVNYAARKDIIRNVAGMRRGRRTGVSAAPMATPETPVDVSATTVQPGNVSLTFMLVVVSWVNFWIDKDAVPARVSLGVTTLLTMTTQASGVNAKLPPVSYTKAIDVWIGVCLAFIFGALLEFALVNYAGRVEFLDKERKKQKVSLVKDNQQSPMPIAMPLPPGVGAASANAPPNFVPMTQAHSTIASTHPGSPPALPPSFGSIMRSSVGGFPMEAVCPQCDAEREERTMGITRPLISSSPLDFPMNPAMQRAMYRQTNAKRSVSCFRMWLSKYKERSKRIDVISRLIFPIGFFFFNCIYWSAYMGNGGSSSSKT